MPVITRLQTLAPESFSSQIQQMLVDYLSDISSVGMTLDNPLYPLYQYGVGFEVHLYLQAMDGQRQLSVEVVLALDDDDPSRVLGFTLYLPADGDPRACTIAYMAVLASHRRQGIARAMLAKVLTFYPQLELACVVRQVPCFEGMGLHVLGARGPQVLMNSHGQASEGRVAVLEVAPIYNSLEVRQIHAYLLKQHGEQSMIDAERQRDDELDRLTEEARVFVRRH